MSRGRCALAATDCLQKEILFQPWPLTSVRIVTSPVKATVGGVTAREKFPQTSRLESYTPKYHARVARGVGTARRAAALEKSKRAAKVDTDGPHAYDSFHIRRVSDEEEVNRYANCSYTSFSDPANALSPKKEGPLLAGGGPFGRCPDASQACLAGIRKNVKRKYWIHCID